MRGDFDAAKRYFKERYISSDPLFKSAYFTNPSLLSCNINGIIILYFYSIRVRVFDMRGFFRKIHAKGLEKHAELCHDF